AYLGEDRYHILKANRQLREIVDPLIDRATSYGEPNRTISRGLKLNDKRIPKCPDAVENNDGDEMVEFHDNVASKTEDLDFLDNLVYSEISKNVKERKERHKFLERMLWVFGEEHSESTKLLSDKNLEKNLTPLRDGCLIFKPPQDGDNINVI